eukprot:TRINITY_DN7020_c0_g1_i2.p1 TRINITY_DN7020_c0_g1~~TRINITY_DN7020_c0_g1_i2.p1  ORF type:complete len:110 (+),score=30.09 TRINITY_DN7020_c0_g1_i2:140-469(+)
MKHDNSHLCLLVTKIEEFVLGIANGQESLFMTDTKRQQQLHKNKHHQYHEHRQQQTKPPASPGKTKTSATCKAKCGNSHRGSSIRTTTTATTATTATTTATTTTTANKH